MFSEILKLRKVFDFAKPKKTDEESIDKELVNESVKNIVLALRCRPENERDDFEREVINMFEEWETELFLMNDNDLTRWLLNRTVRGASDD